MSNHDKCVKLTPRVDADQDRDTRFDEAIDDLFAMQGFFVIGWDEREIIDDGIMGHLGYTKADLTGIETPAGDRSGACYRACADFRELRPGQIAIEVSCDTGERCLSASKRTW